MSNSVLVLLLSAFVIFILALCADSHKVKPYTHYRLSNESTVEVFHFEKTVAIVETERSSMLTCELISAETSEEKEIVFKDISQYVSAEPVKIEFEKMMDLIRSCSALPDREVTAENNPAPTSATRKTKWCSEDLASNYYDLGTAVGVDKCCRAHDLCPLNVPGVSREYGIINIFPLTISHCECNKELIKCLRDTGDALADHMGIAFMILQLSPSCMQMENGKYIIGDTPLKKKPRNN